MSKETTKPNGGSMNVIENSEDVQDRIEKAGYEFQLNAMEAEFTEERVSETSGSASNAASDGTKKAGDYTKVGAVTTIAFKPMIPAIANGPKVKLKEDKSKKTEKSTDKPEIDQEK